MLVVGKTRPDLPKGVDTYLDLSIWEPNVEIFMNRFRIEAMELRPELVRTDIDEVDSLLHFDSLVVANLCVAESASIVVVNFQSFFHC